MAKEQRRSWIGEVYPSAPFLLCIIRKQRAPQECFFKQLVIRSLKQRWNIATDCGEIQKYFAFLCQVSSQ